MIIQSLVIPRNEFEQQTGWVLKPEGACKGDRCVPLFSGDPSLTSVDPSGETVDIRMLSDALGMPIVHDETHGLYAVGPESGGPLLASAECPEIQLPDLDGNEFSISSLRGRKVVIVSWASW
jgi:hypothetical protein